MEFIEHTISWCKGEMLEARIILILGLILLIGTFLFYKTGTTPFSKAIVLPLLLFSMLLIGSGFSMSSLNQKRIIESSYLYKSEKDQFINAEKKRVEEFKKWYPYTRIAMTIFILTGLLAYFFWRNDFSIYRFSIYVVGA